MSRLRTRRGMDKEYISLPEHLQGNNLPFILKMDHEEWRELTESSINWKSQKEGLKMDIF
jgi:hypothetical protein